MGEDFRWNDHGAVTTQCILGCQPSLNASAVLSLDLHLKWGPFVWGKDERQMEAFRAVGAFLTHVTTLRL